jgi:hypothetical protein
MPNRKGRRSFAHLPLPRRALGLLFSALVLAGCGAPGEPQPPAPPIPSAIADLTAHQQGNGVQLAFTLPGRTTNGERLAEPPATEIFRGELKPDGKPDNKSFRLVYTIPGALAERYAAAGKMQFTDPIPAEQLRTHPGLRLVYRVRTRASKKKNSADSNAATVRLYAVADRIASLTAKVTESAVELAWPAPAQAAASGGEAVARYHIYRGELDANSPAPADGDLSQAKWRNPPVFLGPAESNSYSDTFFEFGRTYVYVVRSVTVPDGGPVESDDSAPAIVTPRDTFPPAAPRNVVAAVLPGAAGGQVVDLSWAINVEADLAGYRVYRSEKEGEPGALLDSELLSSPAYRDLSVQTGHRYWYAVSALDRAGNESGRSEAALADLTRTLP